MARPPRRNADYFPYKVKPGRRMRHIRRKYGIKGFAVWILLLELLTDADDHHIDINDDLDRDLFISELMVEPGEFEEIYAELIKIKEFDGALYDKGVIFNYQLLTSLEDAYRKRTGDIITVEEIYARYGLKLSDLPGRYRSQSGAGNPVTGGENPQSKVKHTKENERRENTEISLLDWSVLFKTDVLPLGKDAREVFTRRELDRIPEFIEELKRRGVKGKTAADFRDHFAKWLKAAPASTGSGRMPDTWDPVYMRSLKDPAQVQAYAQHLTSLGFTRSTGPGGTTYTKIAS